MKIRTARKILKPTISKRLIERLRRRYPPYVNEQGHMVYPSWYNHQRLVKAWIIVHRKIRKYGDIFRKL